MERPPDGRKLRIASFAIHSTRGLLRDRAARRKTMFVVVAVALLLMAMGPTLLASALDPHEHPALFILYWFSCAWLTLLALLLALFDMLLIRREARILRENLKQQYVGEKPGDGDGK